VKQTLSNTHRKRRREREGRQRRILTTAPAPPRAEIATPHRRQSTKASATPTARSRPPLFNNEADQQPGEPASRRAPWDRRGRRAEQKVKLIAPKMIAIKIIHDRDNEELPPEGCRPAALVGDSWFVPAGKIRISVKALLRRDRRDGMH